MTPARTTMYTVRPAAQILVDGGPGALLDQVLKALEDDERAIAPVCGYDYDTGRIDSTFRIELTDGPGDNIAAATAVACSIFEDALVRSRLFQVTEAVTVVAGDDPDLLL